MKKEKGFTLMELLAVIVVLSIILVIAIPLINNSSDSTTKSGLELYAKKVLSKSVDQKSIDLAIKKDHTPIVVYYFGNIENKLASHVDSNIKLNKLELDEKSDYEGFVISSSCSGKDNNIIYTWDKKERYEILNADKATEYKENDINNVINELDYITGCNDVTTYRLSLDYQGGLASTEYIEVLGNHLITSLPDTYRPGYSFNGWYTKINSQGEKYTNNKRFTAYQDMTLYAGWDACQAGKYSDELHKTCTMCPTNTISTSAASSTCTACTVCNPGEHATCSLTTNSNHTSCVYTTTCASGYDIVNNGKYNPTCTPHHHNIYLVKGVGIEKICYKLGNNPEVCVTSSTTVDNTYATSYEITVTAAEGYTYRGGNIQDVMSDTDVTYSFEALPNVIDATTKCSGGTTLKNGNCVKSEANSSVCGKESYSCNCNPCKEKYACNETYDCSYEYITTCYKTCSGTYPHGAGETDEYYCGLNCNGKLNCKCEPCTGDSLAVSCKYTYSCDPYSCTKTKKETCTRTECEKDSTCCNTCERAKTCDVTHNDKKYYECLDGYGDLDENNKCYLLP